MSGILDMFITHLLLRFCAIVLSVAVDVAVLVVTSELSVPLCLYMYLFEQPPVIFSFFLSQSLQFTLLSCHGLKMPLFLDGYHKFLTFFHVLLFQDLR